MGGGEDEAVQPLFATKQLKGRVAYRCFASTIFVGICLILVSRLKHIPSAEEHGRWAWIGLFMAELWFGFYWIITQSVRWNVIHRVPFKDRLLQRYGEKLPGVDIFVCTADPTLEPPTLVVNTRLASRFSKHWIPFCKKFKVEPRSPQGYFVQHNDSQDITYAHEWLAIKKLYEEMKNRIESAVEVGSIPKEVRDQHKGFSEWDSKITKKDHQSIVQILIDGRDTNAIDSDGNRLPTLVYIAREKRPANKSVIRDEQWTYNPKPDCDMYSNDPDAIMDALCFFLDEEKGHRVSYVQYPQHYNNVHKSNIYSCSNMVVNKIELAGLDGYGGALYCGTGCFHRRESLCGRRYSEDFKAEWSTRTWKNAEELSRSWKKHPKSLPIVAMRRMGLMYGCSVEDVITGLVIQCKGWEPVYYSPCKRAFLGVAATTLDDALINTRGGLKGCFRYFSKYCPFFYGHRKIKLGAQMGYCVYLLWAPNSLPMLYYTIVPPLFLLRGVALFPEIISTLNPNVNFYLFGTTRGAYLLAFPTILQVRLQQLEAVWCGDSFKAWWNLERTWLIRSATSYLFALIDNLTKQLGLSETTFVITAKVADEGVLKRYQQEIIEFGNVSLMVTIISTLALLNLFSLVGGMTRVIFSMEFRGGVAGLIPHIILCGLTVMLNLPVYHALFIRSDKGRIPSSVMFKSIVLSSLACLLPYLL
ncbi:Cellulose synthase-like protein E6 [Vitis vinifera]|uniref:Cellulose synthase-like protein E6 n=1 Tax=Vitis vinifera TaxID=29760 RepID=A0A438K0G1_VITVI|nr:Cellulose synthase-like protein E6 [Vitis vinifera]